MELAAAALKTIVSTIGSTAAAGAGAAAGAAGAGGLASTFASILQGAGSVASILGTLSAGADKAQSYKLAARDADLDAVQEEIKGTQRQNSIRRALLETLAERDIAFAASGIDIGTGTPAVARAEATRDAERQLSVDQESTRMRKVRLQEKAIELRRQGRQARVASYLTAFQQGAQGLTDIMERG